MMCQVEGVENGGSSRGGFGTAKKAPSVLSLFNMKLNNKFWTESVLSRGTYWVPFYLVGVYSQ